jgi:hypothetical protein
MTPTTDQNELHWRTIQFLQEAGPIFNLIHPFKIRDWALKYTLWLRDKNIVTLPAPVLDRPTQLEARQAAEIRRQLDAVAKKFFETL